MKEPLIKLDMLSVGYKDSVVISKVNLEIFQGQFVCLLGPNGAGKTTLLRTISRHIPPISGDILLEGIPFSRYKQGELARIIAVVLTERVAPPLFSVHQFVALGRYPYTDFLGRLKERDRRAVETALASVNASHLKDRDFLSLSDGERQKVLLARALCQEPKILLLDEPTAHLDLKHRVEVMAILRKLCREKGLTVISSIHDVDLAARVADKVALIRNGRIHGWGSPEDVLTPEAVAALYDFHRAMFTVELGAIELSPTAPQGKVFVVSGAGSGCPVYRALARKGFEVATGVLLENDMDFFVARALGANIVSQPPGASLSRNKIDEALGLVTKCQAVVDALPGNHDFFNPNRKILQAARGKGLPTIKKNELWRLLKNPPNKNSFLQNRMMADNDT